MNEPPILIDDLQILAIKTCCCSRARPISVPFATAVDGSYRRVVGHLLSQKLVLICDVFERFSKEWIEWFRQGTLHHRVLCRVVNCDQGDSAEGVRLLSC